MHLGHNSTTVTTIPLSQQHRCHNNTAVTTTPLSQQHRCHNNTAVTTTPLSQQHHCHSNTTVTATPMSQQHHHQNNTTVTTTPLSQQHQCHNNTTITIIPLSQQRTPLSSFVVTFDCVWLHLIPFQKCSNLCLSLHLGYRTFKWTCQLYLKFNFRAGNLYWICHFLKISTICHMVLFPAVVTKESSSVISS